MAEFCKQCTIDLGFDLPSGLADEKLPDDFIQSAICEGCGFITVTTDGSCWQCDLKVGEPGHDIGKSYRDS